MIAELINVNGTSQYVSIDTHLPLCIETEIRSDFPRSNRLWRACTHGNQILLAHLYGCRRWAFTPERLLQLLDGLFSFLKFRSHGKHLRHGGHFLVMAFIIMGIARLAPWLCSIASRLILGQRVTIHLSVLRMRTLRARQLAQVRPR